MKLTASDGLASPTPVSLTATVTATTATVSTLTQPQTATYYQHFQPELGIRYT
jgi:hypothetical protein